MPRKKLLILLSIMFIIAIFSIIHVSLYEEQIDFNTQIRPILNKNCISCHGGVKQSGGFSLLFPEEAIKPNESGKAAIVPGHPEESEMIRRITDHDPEKRMPLQKDPLPENEIELISKWIKQGATWGDHWSYVKPKPVDVPIISSDWIKNDIDRFILTKLEENGLEPSSQADKANLLRRVSLDLIGLPPTFQETQTFLKNQSPQAFEKVVEKLLLSPRFGERWASMWMDVARYADSRGYEADAERSIWQYRDWLIKAFNEDKPYDKFIIDQIAGDLLPNPDDNSLIATAFHRNTLSNGEGGTDNEEYRVAAVIDRVNTTWNGILGTTMECVQCHSHPYDPFRHEDYYKSYAFFNNTADEDANSESPTLKIFTDPAADESLKKIKNWVVNNTLPLIERSKKASTIVNLIRLSERKMHGHYFDQIEKGKQNVGYLDVEDGGSSRLRNVPLHRANQMLVSYISKKSTGVVSIRLDSLSGPIIGTWKIKKNVKPRGFEVVGVAIKPIPGIHDLYFTFKNPGEKDYVCTIEWVVFNEELPGKNIPGYSEVNHKFFSLLNDTNVIETPVMVELKGDYRRNTFIFERGNWMVHGNKVVPGVPEVFKSLPKRSPNNRLGMSQWIVNKENPLTARVIVNRLWAQLFGVGIVETIEDFGSMGTPPSHPHLLDWLSLQLMNEYNWSIKKLLKSIVLSAAYQQSSKVTPEQWETDPQNRLLARGPRVRLTAEQIRDQALAVSGLLSHKMYGPSVMPIQPQGIWQAVYSNLKWETSIGEDKHRRALYTFWRRSKPYPSLIAFDSPDHTISVNRRIPTNTPLQALVTLNDPVFMEAAYALASRMSAENQTGIKGQIKKGYQLAVMKEINIEKLRELQHLYEQSVRHFKKNPQEAEKLIGKTNISLAALTVVANVIMNLDEFITKT